MIQKIDSAIRFIKCTALYSAIMEIAQVCFKSGTHQDETGTYCCPGDV